MSHLEEGSSIYYYEGKRGKAARRRHKKKSPLVWILLILLVVLVAECIGYGWYFIWYTKPVVTLRGEAEMTVDVNSGFQDPGASALVGTDKDISSRLEQVGHVDFTKVGDYSVTYGMIYHGDEYSVNRIFHVRDISGPDLVLKDADATFEISSMKEFKDPGYTATDNLDGDVTDQVTVSTERIDGSTLRLLYSVTDAAGNTSEAERQITVEDSEPPVITLKGEPEIFLAVGDTFSDPGATAEDAVDGDLQEAVTVEGEVDPQTPGDYTLTYHVKDASGNEATVTRIVSVKEAEELPEENGSIIYLTFDDGPSSEVTPKILDILKKNGVKATFFILNYSESNLPILKRMLEEGHTIGMHAWDHDYAAAYGSMDSYYDGIKKLRDKVQADTGYEAFCFRFPGGSSNTVSKKYTPGVISHLAEVMQADGWQYYDWNVDSTDAEGNNRPVETLVQNVTGYLQKDRGNVVLCHDTNAKATTAQALQQIIDYGKEHGYTFRAISRKTKAVHHKIAN